MVLDGGALTAAFAAILYACYEINIVSYLCITIALDFLLEKDGTDTQETNCGMTFA